MQRHVEQATSLQEVREAACRAVGFQGIFHQGVHRVFRPTAGPKTLGHLGRVLVAVVRVEMEGLGDQSRQGPRNQGVAGAGVVGGLGDLLPAHDVASILFFQWRAAGQEREENRPQGVDIVGRPGIVGGHQHLRRHEGQQGLQTLARRIGMPVIRLARKMGLLPIS